ncbi:MULTISPECIES: alpha/beta hydrolase [unclassified Streptomyces]|uniref:alpha/beta hydrolase n=1 Tax=unclassified Streptomyces TaxID=2593676 RepID=UPI00037A25FF|nr:MULTISPECIES: alpha/beta hydrolase [unclassified Streptomyces]MYT33351.1 alpha/beta hydrolase [Streptomyces sp. SID8354]
MAQQALPVREARLGKPLGAGGTDRTVNAVALLLPGCGPNGLRRPSPVPALAVRPLAARLARAGRPEGLAAHVVHYRCRGWNGTAAHPAQDAAWAVDEVVRRYGDVPVALVGTGMGARAALHAAGHPAVHAVLGLAPWLADPCQYGTAPDPVKQLIGRQVLLVHGTNDERVDPDLSYRYAQRAKKINRDTCRFEVHSDGHSLHQHRSEVHALATDFLLGALFTHAYARPVKDALAAPPPLGLRMPLASGFGTSLRH